MRLILTAIFQLAMVAGSYSAHAETITLAELPVLAENENNGILVDLVKAMGHERGTDIEIKVVPFARSLRMVASGESDAHLPFLDAGNGKVPFDGLAYGTSTVFEVPFAVYVNKASSFSLEQLNNYEIETEAAHVPLFEFSAKPSTCIPCSLKKVNSGRIDGFVFAEKETDQVIASEGLSEISKVPFKIFPAKFLIRVGDKKTDDMLSELLEKLERNGEYDKVLSKLAN